MTKYMFIYHAPMAPADATPPSQEEMQAIMGQWNAWGDKVGDGLLDFGAPMAHGVRVTPDGTAPSTHEVAGYSMLEADSLDDAVALAQDHPHLNMPGGCTIEVHEAQPVPGM